MRRLFQSSLFALAGVLATAPSARAQESVYNAYIEAARKAQDEAEKAKLYRLALQEAEGLNNPKLLAQALLANGMFEEGRGNYPEAERLMKRGLGLAREPLFAAHANALLGNLYRNSSRPAQALLFYKKAVELREANQPPTSFEFSQALRDLADCQRELGNLDAAAPIYAKAISIVENQPRHKYHLAYALSGLAELRLAQDNPTASEALARQALSIFEGMETRPSFNQAICFTTLARVKERADQADEALALYRSAITHFDDPRPSNHIRLVAALQGAARLLKEGGRTEEAQALAKRAEEIRALRTVGPRQGG